MESLRASLAQIQINQLIDDIELHQCDLQRVKHFIDQGLDVNARNNEGHTLLIAAAISKNNNHRRDIAAYLLKTGAQIDMVVQFGKTALLGSSYLGNHDVLTLLLDSGADVNLANLKGDTALILAAQQGFTAIVKALIQAGADVNLQNKGLQTKGGYTALMTAAVRGHSECVAALIQSNADVNMPAHNGSTALMHAAKEGHTTVVKLLIQAKAHVDLQDENGETALSYASLCEQKDTVAELIESHADLNLQNIIGFTALMSAASYGFSGIVELLIQADAKINSVSIEGDTALDVASSCGHGNIASLILESTVNRHDSSNFSFPLHLAIKQKNVEIVEKLLRNGADTQECNESGRNALDIAKLTNEPTIISLIENAKKIRRRFLLNQKRKLDKIQKTSAKQVVCGHENTLSGNRSMSVKEQQQEAMQQLNCASSAAEPLANMASNVNFQSSTTKSMNVEYGIGDIDDIDDTTDDTVIMKRRSLISDLICPGMYYGWWDSDDDVN